MTLPANQPPVSQRWCPAPRSKRALVLAVVSVFAVLLSSCNGGLRPTLVEDEVPTPAPALRLDLAPAPDTVTPLPPAPADLPLEASVDDALLAWASNRSVPYLDACSRSNPGPGELCDVATERDTVRLLGPNPGEIWYVVTVIETDSLDFGRGYRVNEVEIAGR